MAMSFSLKTIVASAMFGLAGFAIAHGNVTPQEVDTGNLPELGDEVRIENPFREGNEFGEFNAQASENRRECLRWQLRRVPWHSGDVRRSHAGSSRTDRVG